MNLSLQNLARINLRALRGMHDLLGWKEHLHLGWFHCWKVNITDHNSPLPIYDSFWILLSFCFSPKSSQKDGPFWRWDSTVLNSHFFSCLVQTVALGPCKSIVSLSSPARVTFLHPFTPASKFQDCQNISLFSKYHCFYKFWHF